MLIDERIYEFSFAATHKAIVEEKLAIITNIKEKTLYHRLNGQAKFDSSLAEDQFLHFAFKGTRDNQLFITNSISQKVDTFLSVYNWFKDTLVLIAPNSRFLSFEQFIDESHPLFSIMNEMLPQLDTGISRIGGEEISFENTGIPSLAITQLQEGIKEGMTVQVFNLNNDQFLITRKNGELIAKKLMAYHIKADGSQIKFEINQESDGSRRLIDILPAFLDLLAHLSKKVYVIDELDRSLHTLLTRSLIERYLSNCSAKTRSQLLLTTHDVLLMDQKILRRDEMWVAQRDNAGASTMYSFSEYKDVRYDKHIRNSYLQGRLGGIPMILEGGISPKSVFVNESKEPI